jgi:hypothetical protein
MRLQTALPIGTLLLALVGCAADRKPVTSPVTTTQTKNAPAWIDNEEIPDGLAAVGSAQSNVMGDKSLQRTTALADGRTKLAGKLKVRVQNMFSQLNQQVTAASAQTGAKPIKTEAMNRVIENVTRQLIDQELAGTNTRYVYTDPEDGTLYMFVVLTKASMDQALASTAKAQIRKEIAQGEVALNSALDKLDAAIAASASKPVM